MLARQHQRTRGQAGTLITAGNLAACLICQGKHAEAEQMQREVHEVQAWVVLGQRMPTR